MPCGCSKNCGCELVAGNSLVTVLRIGDTFTISASDQAFVKSVSDTDCISLAVDGGGDLTASPIIAPITTPVSIACSGAGLVGDLIIDPASTAPVSTSAAGLRVDCCTDTTFIEAIDDTNTVDLSLALGVLTAGVIPNPLAGIENQPGGVSIKLQGDPAPIPATCGNRLRFNVAGDLTELQDGIDVTDIPAGAAVSLAGTAGVDSGASSTFLLTNNDTCPVFVLFDGVGIISADSNGTGVSTRAISQQMRLAATLLTGGAVDIGGAGLAASSDYNYQGSSPTAIPATKQWRFQAHLSKWVYMPPGSTVTMVANSTALEDVVGWNTTVGAGGSFLIDNYKFAVFPERIGGWLVS